MVSTMPTMCTEQNLSPQEHGKLTSVHPGYLLQLVVMDILGLLPESSTRTHTYVLVVSNYSILLRTVDGQKPMPILIKK